VKIEGVVAIVRMKDDRSRTGFSKREVMSESHGMGQMRLRYNVGWLGKFRSILVS
jgi:hypothetical protein